MYAVKYRNIVMGADHFEVFQGETAREDAERFAERHARKYKVDTFVYRLDLVNDHLFS